MRILLSLLALVFLAFPATAQDSVKVGDPLPKLPSAVASGSNGTVLLVFRSADW